jgi:ion channel-forming bestrophin family protein
VTDRPSLLWRIWPPLPVWKRLDATVLLVVVYSFIVKYLSDLEHWNFPKWIGDMAVVNGILLGVLLGFRNVQAYDRWWEARKLWGQLINDSRNLCLKVKVLTATDADDLRRFGRFVVGFALALRNHLRGGQPLQTVPGFEQEAAEPTHVPLHLAEGVFAQLRAWRAGGKITDFDALLIDPHAKALMDVSGACERIRSSPVPLSYRALLRHGTILYLASAPWFMAGEYGYMAIGVVALLAYFLLGIEMTAEDVEEPFGKDGDDLELTRFCETIRKSAEQVLGDLGYGDLALSTVTVPRVR